MKKLLALMFALLLTLQAFAATAPTGIKLDITEKTIDLAETDTFTLTAAVTPDGASRFFKWMVSDSSVLSVENGKVKALKPGEATISVSVHGYGMIKATCNVKVLDSRAPERILAYPARITGEPSKSFKLEAVAMPLDKTGAYVYKSANESVAKVTASGLVTLVGPGETTVTVMSRFDSRVKSSVPVKSAYGERITSIKVSESELSLEKGQAYQLTLSVAPQNASKAIVFLSSDTKVVSVDENGLVTARGAGKATVTVKSYRDPSINVSVKFTVTDANRPESIQYQITGGANLMVGEEREVQASFLPEAASQDYTLSSSREDILSVSGSRITGVSHGVSVLTIQNSYIPDIKAEISVSVSDDGVCVEMPLRRTDKTLISENLGKIDRLKQSAMNVLQELYDAGTVTASEAKTRKKIIENAFEMYAFPWAVDKKVYYWEKANSENGAKNFVPGIIYYGLPYTSGVNHNRSYDVKKALEQERYIKVEGEDYYLLNRASKYFITGYAGNDCSAFVALAIWGSTTHNGEAVKTGTLYSDSRLKYFNDPKELRPGDILVKHSSHVVMFLYWADEQMTQAVILQQGGSEKAINTVNAWVTDIGYYTNDYYRLRHTAW